MTRYRFVEAESSRYPVTQLCRITQVSRTAYYEWPDRPPSQRAQDDVALLATIKAIHAASDGQYGVPRVLAELRAQGHEVGRKRRSSSRSSVVSPSLSPASTAACSTQRRTAVSLRSISRQIVGIVRSPCRTKATTSALNALVNDRRGRRPAPWPSTFFRIRTPSSWAHAHI